MNKLIVALVLLAAGMLAACGATIAETPQAILQPTAETNVKATLMALPNGYTHGVLRPAQDAPLQITPSVAPTVAAAGTAAAVPAAGSAAAGQQLFVSKGCIGCHRAEANVTGPPLQNVYGAAVRLQSGETVLADDAYVRMSILNPAAQVVAAYPAVMPSYQGHVTEDELAALVAYIRSLGTQP